MSTCFVQARNAEATYRGFRDQVASILQVEPYEDKIRERLNNLMLGSRDKSSVRIFKIAAILVL